MQDEWDLEVLIGENATAVRWKDHYGLKTECFPHSHGALAELDSDESLFSALAVTPAGGDLEKKFRGSGERRKSVSRSIGGKIGRKKRKGAP